MLIDQSDAANSIWTAERSTMRPAKPRRGPASTIRSNFPMARVFDNRGVSQDQCTAGHDFENAAVGAARSLNDDGSFIKSASSSQGSFLQGVSFNVTSGSVDVQTGTLELLGGGTDTGATFTSETGAARSISVDRAHWMPRAVLAAQAPSVRGTGHRRHGWNL